MIRDAGTSVSERPATDGHGAIGGIRPRHSGQCQRARTHLSEERVGSVIETDEATGESGRSIIEAGIQDRGAGRAEDVARASERTPGRGNVRQIIAGPIRNRQASQTGAGIRDAVHQPAFRDR